MEFRVLITNLLGPFKYEVFFIFIFFFIPVVFALMIFSEKIERIFFFLINFLTSRAPTFENISLTQNVEYFKGTIWSHNIHIGDILSLVFLFLVIVKKEFRKYFKLIPEGTIPLFLYGFCSSLSVINSSEFTIERSFYAMSLFFRQFVFFYCLANYLRVPGRREFQLKSFFFVALYSAIIGIQQRYLLGLQRVAADFAHPNSLVFYLVPVMVIFTPILFNAKDNGYNRKIGITAVLSALVPCLLTISRGFLVHFAVGIVAVIVLDFLLKFNLKKPLIIVSFVLGMLLFSVKAWDTWADRFEFGSNPAGTAQRKAYYLIGYAVLKSKMWFGIGINQFGTNAYQIEILNEVLEYDRVKNDKGIKDFVQSTKNGVKRRIKKNLPVKKLFGGGNPESFYVMHFAETGLVGIFGTMFCQIFFILSALRSVIYFRRRNIFLYSLSVGLVGAQLGIYTQSIFEYILRQENPMYLQGILFAMVSSVAAERRSKRFHHIDLSKNKQLEVLDADADEPPPLPTFNS